MFHEICIYEAKLDKQDEIEQLMKEVKTFYKSQKGVIDVFYIKRNHRQKDFNAVKAGELPIELTRYIGKVTYMLHMILENKEAAATKCGSALAECMFPFSPTRQIVPMLLFELAASNA